MINILVFKAIVHHCATLDKTISKVVSIPVGWWINQEQREYIVDCIKKGW
jgi:hypothetical protein